MTTIDTDYNSVVVAVEDDNVILTNTESSSVYVSFDDSGLLIGVETSPVYVGITPNAGGYDANRVYEYVHNQMTPSDVWVINHDLNKYCSITVVDSGKNIVYGDVQYNSTTQITVTFEAEFSGQAFLN